MLNRVPMAKLMERHIDFQVTEDCTELPHRSDYGDFIVNPLCLQPADDGLIRNPTLGKSLQYKVTYNSLITAEVFAKHEQPAPLNDVKINIDGRGIDAEYITDNKGSAYLQKIQNPAIACGVYVSCGADGRNRTDDLLITSELLYL